MAVSEHLEIERKYDVEHGVELPDLSGVPDVSSVPDPEELDLAADYFDTRDLRLAAAGITLRRRTGGVDEGWHLKLPADGGRREIQVPLGDEVESPPAPLRRLVVAYARREPLGLVVSLQTRRIVHRLLGDDGAVLAEVCDDNVTAALPGWDAEPPAWREWEAELADGNRSLLDDVDVLLACAGALRARQDSKLQRVLGSRVPSPPASPPPPSATGRAVDLVLTYVSEQRDELLRLDPALRSDAPEAVHDTRVALRRLRSSLATYRKLFDRDAVAHLRTEASWLAGTLGNARDAEVLRGHLRSALAKEPAELVLGSVVTRLDDELSNAFQRGHDAAQAVLDEDRYLDLLDEIDAFLDRPPTTDLAGSPARQVVPKLLRHDWRRLDKAIGRAESLPAGNDRDEALHEVRKAAKRLRYAAESATPVFGKRAHRLAKSAKKLQTLLGDHHDTSVARDLLRRVGIEAHLAGDNAFTYGRLHGLYQARAQHLDHRWPKAWKRVERPRPKEWG